MSALASLGAWWLEHGLGLVVSTGLLLLLAEGLSRLSRPWLGAGIRLWLYVPVLLRIVVPLGLGRPLGGAAPPELVVRFAPLLIQAQGTPEPTPGTAWIGALYLIGVVLAIRPVIAGQRAITQILAEAEPARLRAGLVVAVHPTAGPLVAGLLRPTIVLPRGVLGHQGLPHVLAHELAHLQRGDLWLHWSLIVARIVLWPVLPAWPAIARIRHLIEIAADERATRLAPLSERRAYGEALITFACPPTLAAVGSFHTLKERIMILRKPVHPSPLAQLVGGILLASVALAACVELPQGTEPGVQPVAGEPHQPGSLEPEPHDDAAEDAVGGAPRILGQMDRELIDAVIQRHMDPIRYCYQRELAHDPELEGRIVLSFTIAASGEVSEATVDETSMDNAAVEDCVRDRFLQMQFPERQGGGEVVVHYPFLFEPG